MFMLVHVIVHLFRVYFWHTEKDLVLEIDRLKYGKNGVKRRSKSANQMESLLRKLEQERDYWRGEVEVGGLITLHVFNANSSSILKKNIVIF